MENMIEGEVFSNYLKEKIKKFKIISNFHNINQLQKLQASSNNNQDFYYPKICDECCFLVLDVETLKKVDEDGDLIKIKIEDVYHKICIQVIIYNLFLYF